MLLSMASLVIFMQLRVLYEQLCSRLRRHGNYKRLLQMVELVCTKENRFKLVKFILWKYVFHIYLVFHYSAAL